MFDFTAHHVVVFFTRMGHVPSFIKRCSSNDWPILPPLALLLGSSRSTTPFLNTLPVCNTIRVDSMLCETV